MRFHYFYDRISAMIDEEINDEVLEQLSSAAIGMFERDLLKISRCSISYKLGDNKFVINTRGAMFERLSRNDLIVLSYKRDYSWKDASLEAPIHAYIYKEIGEAKCIAHAVCPYIVAYSINNDVLIPQDYHGTTLFREIPLYDPKDYSSWNERADVEIGNALKQSETNFVVVKGYGIYAYARDFMQLTNTISLLEHSAKILVLSKV